MKSTFFSGESNYLADEYINAHDDKAFGLYLMNKIRWILI